MARMSTATIGYPRIGPNREMKKALESYWKGSISEEALRGTVVSVEADAWSLQAAAGISRIGLDGTMYDHVLDMAFALSLVPKRFSHVPPGLPRYFAMARGADGVPALDMSKYFNTNYHYLVPEVAADTEPELDATAIIDRVRRGQAAVGAAAAVPVLTGPITLARLARLGDGVALAALVSKLAPLYADLLAQLKALGVPEVQMQEPALCLSDAANDKALYQSTYATLAAAGVRLDLVTFFDDLGDTFSWAVQLPVAAVSLDFCGVVGAAISCRTLELLKEHGFPKDKRLGVGVINGRGVWADQGRAAAVVAEVLQLHTGAVSVQPSCSLQFVPLDTARETNLPPALLPRLAFAKQKLAELTGIASAAAAGGSSSKGTQVPALVKLREAPFPPEALLTRPATYELRREEQYKTNPRLRTFPTTTIGSFPQTAAVRAARADHAAGRLTAAELEAKMDAFIAHTIGVQEALDIDVLVHGEPERTDMVEFFGRQLEGLEFTTAGWVQSYGSRYVRPPIIHGAVRRVARDGAATMTVREYRVAAALTQRPVKGMLTGPVTILNWSFPREDIVRAATAFELAAAVRAEVADLEAAGCTIIQVDEPALREGLPLKREQWESYLAWAVAAFRAATGIAAPRTQIVTHLCYSDFQDILPAIDGLDADVLTIENSRSGDAMLTALAAAGYGRDIGPGVYDVHSPVVPPVDALVDKLRMFVATGILGSDARRIWVNPDCGLKTRGWPEVIASLRNMVRAAEVMRSEVGLKGPQH